MVLPVAFKAVPRTGYSSLRVIYPNSHDPNGLEFGKIRQTTQGWDIWGDTEDMGRALKAALHRAGRHSPIKDVLAEIRQAYLDFAHEGETAPAEAGTSEWTVIASVVDATGDDLPDACRQYHLTLVETIKGDEETGEGNRYIYMNPDKTIKMTTVPFWHPAPGQTHRLTLSKKTHPID